ncbi:LysR family transcriptional regulator [Azospirillum halopraeferens]|uniref:LysR family transcriptional regulator n=1 Tax=Azospirillum halopraeferens TaxID=34010 RepID=UPI000416BE77|nr:LysR family transcriptional regulator [Azospirillum halopraeferens]
MHTTFRQLEAFEATARLGSMARAAEELRLTQPTLSMQIRKLSDEVGAPLFDHVGRTLRLTEEGRELLIMCREVFGAVARFEMALAQRRGLQRGTLRVAAATTGKYFVPRLLGAFCRLYPCVDVELEVVGRPQVLARLREGLDDLYVFSQVPEEPAVDAIPFRDDALVVVAPADHPLAGRSGVPLEEVVQEPLILREPGSGTRTAVNRLFEDNGLRPRVRMQLGSNEAIKQAVIGGLGLSILPQVSLEHDDDRRLVRVDVRGFPMPHRWYLVHPAGRCLSTAARAFIDIAKEPV